MSDRPTPETDEAERLGSDKGCWVRADFARKLERERDEARKALKEALKERDKEWFQVIESFSGFHSVSITDALNQGIKFVKKIKDREKERDEAREDLRVAQEAWVKAKAERIEALRERDEARGKYTTLLTENMFSVHQLCKERDEAREKIKRQAKRIHELEGATNHAEGTPLTIALRERDEAQNRMADALQEVDLRTLDFERMKQAIIATLEENRHLADGDDCTLAKLKSIVPEWK